VTAKKYHDFWLNALPEFDDHYQRMTAKASTSLEALSGLTGST
jgi:hypothetical protein